MSNCVLEARGVVYEYPDGTRALKGLTCTVEHGKKVAFLGPNGAGKSTLFLQFNGLLRPTRGEIRFAGRRVGYDRRSLAELRQHVGLVFQDPDIQLFSASVYQEIAFGPLNLGLSPEESRQRVEQVLLDTGLNCLRDRPIHALSLGQKKLVGLADVLAMRPSVLIADEPTAHLDPPTASLIMSMLDKVNHEGTTVIISTHDVDLAYAWADQVLLVDDGQVRWSGSPEDFFSNNQLISSAGLPLPWVLDVYLELSRAGWLAPKPLPRTRHELIHIIRSARK